MLQKQPSRHKVSFSKKYQCLTLIKLSCLDLRLVKIKHQKLLNACDNN